MLLPSRSSTRSLGVCCSADDRSGVASQSVMRKQIAVLNSAYQASNFVFNLVFSELVYNSAWCVT